MTDTKIKSKGKNGMSSVVIAMAMQAQAMAMQALAMGQAMYEPQSRGTIRAEQVKVKPRKDGRFPYLSNHPCGSRAFKRNRRQRGV